jgi:peptide/nickel transport system permease protein
LLIFTIRRAISSFLVLIASSFIVFMFAASQYDPLKPYRARNPLPSPAFFAAKRHEYHLDESIWLRYWNWVSHLIDFHWNSWMFIRFNFGDDVSGAPVSTQLAQRLEITLRMIILAAVLAVVIAIVAGVVSGVRRDKPIDLGVTILTFMLLALPTFWFAAVIKEFAIYLNQHAGTNFYTIGDSTPGLQTYATHGQILHDEIVHLTLPVISLALLTTSGWIRYQRASTIGVLEADYMRLARAKGVRNRTVIRRHGLRNALIPLVTIVAIDVGALFGGAIITEKVYVWHGMGEFLNTALTAEDTYSVAGWVMVSAIFVVVFNFIADLLYAVLDPRIRLA